MAGRPDLRATQAPARNLPLRVTPAGFTLLAWVTLHWFEGSGIPGDRSLELLGMTTVIEVSTPTPVPNRPVPVADRSRRLVAGPPATDSLSNGFNTKKETRPKPGP